MILTHSVFGTIDASTFALKGHEAKFLPTALTSRFVYFCGG